MKQKYEIGDEFLYKGAGGIRVYTVIKVEENNNYILQYDDYPKVRQNIDALNALYKYLEPKPKCKTCGK